MNTLLDDIARALGVVPLTPHETTALLDCTRDVAHAGERRAAPLTAFLLGAAVAASADRGADLDRAITDVRALLGADPPAG